VAGVSASAWVFLYPTYIANDHGCYDAPRAGLVSRIFTTMLQRVTDGIRVELRFSIGQMLFV